MQEYEGGMDMKFGEMLGWALRLRALGALRAWVGARGPAGGIGADGSHGSRILEVIVKFAFQFGSRDAQCQQQNPLWVIIR